VHGAEACGDPQRNSRQQKRDWIFCCKAFHLHVVCSVLGAGYISVLPAESIDHTRCLVLFHRCRVDASSLQETASSAIKRAVTATYIQADEIQILRRSSSLHVLARVDTDRQTRTDVMINQLLRIFVYSDIYKDFYVRQGRGNAVRLSVCLCLC